MPVYCFALGLGPQLPRNNPKEKHLVQRNPGSNKGLFHFCPVLVSYCREVVWGSSKPAWPDDKQHQPTGWAWGRGKLSLITETTLGGHTRLHEPGYCVRMGCEALGREGEPHGWHLILAGVSPGAPPSSPALGKGWEQAELRASWLWWGRMCKGLEQNELEWDCVGQRGWRGSQREGAGGCCGSIPNPLTGAGFHGSPLRPGDLGSCYGSQPPSRSPGARLFQEQLPICLQQEAGNEFRVLLRWRARPSLSLLNSTQFPHIHTPSSFLIPQGRELWLEEATPSTSNPCQLAGRAGRAAILAPPGCRMCHPLPGSGGVRSDPSGDIMEYPGLSASGRASAMQLAWPPPSPSHSSPSASPTPRGWGPTRMGTKPCFSLSLRTSGSCQDTTLVRCLKSHSQTQRIFVAGSLASSLW